MSQVILSHSKRRTEIFVHLRVFNPCLGRDLAQLRYGSSCAMAMLHGNVPGCTVTADDCSMATPLAQAIFTCLEEPPALPANFVRPSITYNYYTSRHYMKTTTAHAALQEGPEGVASPPLPTCIWHLATQSTHAPNGSPPPTPQALPNACLAAPSPPTIRIVSPPAGRSQQAPLLSHKACTNAATWFCEIMDPQHPSLRTPQAPSTSTAPGAQTSGKTAPDKIGVDTPLVNNPGTHHAPCFKNLQE